MAAKKEAAKTLKITLVKSTIGQIPKARATVEAMGLRKLNQTVELPDNAATRGQIQRVRHMVKVEETLKEVSDNGIIKFKTGGRIRAQQ